MTTAKVQLVSKPASSRLLSAWSRHGEAFPTVLCAALVLSNGARHGIRFKGSAFIETMGRIKAVAFDKTGTLTTGLLRVTDVVVFGADGVARVLSMAAAVESLSSHPLARAIVAEAG